MNQTKLEKTNDEIPEKMQLTNDFVFKRVFTKDGNEDLLKDFLIGILGVNIKELEIKNSEISKDMLNSKIGILDIRAKIDNSQMVDIEMQVRNENNMGKRSTFYLTELCSEQLKQGQEYDEMIKTISINILNFNYYKRNSYHHVAHMKFEQSEESKRVDMGYEVEDDKVGNELEMHFIELPKFIKKNPDVKGKLEQWLWLIVGEEEKIKMAESENEEILKAKEVLETINQDEHEKELYRLRMKALRDEASRCNNAYRKGKKEVVIKMLEEKAEIDFISRVTGITKEEIKQIQKTIN